MTEIGQTQEKGCGWLGCVNSADAILDGRSLCRVHFYRIAAGRLEGYRTAIEKDTMSLAERGSMLGFLSEVVNESTGLMARAKSLTESQRKEFLDLSLSASEFYKRAQRSPRTKCDLPIVLRRESEAVAAGEPAKAVNVSKRGACVETSTSWSVGETIWIRRPDVSRQARAVVVWLKILSPSKKLTGLHIVDAGDFWGLEQ
jgi:hypothetical protein